MDKTPWTQVFAGLVVAAIVGVIANFFYLHINLTKVEVRLEALEKNLVAIKREVQPPPPSEQISNVPQTGQTPVLPVNVLQITNPTSQSFPLIGPIRATGRHTLPLNAHVWALLGDVHGNYYLQNQPVVLDRNGDWIAYLKCGQGITSVNLVLVDQAGNRVFQSMVTRGEWGAFTQLPANTQILATVRTPS